MFSGQAAELSHSRALADCCSSVRARAADKPSWTAKLLANPELLCKKVREEAGELCQTLEQGEGRERAASEAADLFYHAMVLLNAQVGLAGAPVRRAACLACSWQGGTPAGPAFARLF